MRWAIKKYWWGWLLVVAICIAGFAGCVGCMGTRPPHPPPPSPEDVYTNYSMAYSSLNRLFVSLQDRWRTDPDMRVRNVNDLIPFLKGLDARRADDHIEIGAYSIFIDSSTSATNRQFPLVIAIPFDWLKRYPIDRFPVLLFRPEDNPWNAYSTQIRLLFTNFSGVNFLGDTPRLKNKALLSRYSFETQYDKNYWPLYSQSAERTFFSETPSP